MKDFGRWFNETTNDLAKTIPQSSKKTDALKKAEIIVQQWISNNDPHLTLSLSNLELTELPDIPDTVTYLTCVNNKLTKLPKLPTSLLGLYCQNNSISQLPELSPNLMFLNCSYNHLTSLPKFHRNLRSITCIGNRIHNIDNLGYSFNLDCDSFVKTTRNP